jgi:hypothetical protein
MKPVSFWGSGSVSNGPLLFQFKGDSMRWGGRDDQERVTITAIVPTSSDSSMVRIALEGEHDGGFKYGNSIHVDRGCLCSRMDLEAVFESHGLALQSKTRDVRPMLSAVGVDLIGWPNEARRGRWGETIE